MSGYRSLHREKICSCPIWHVETSNLLAKPSSIATHRMATTPAGDGGAGGTSWRIWVACGDGVVRGFIVQEKSITQKGEGDPLDASACTCSCTHVLLGKGQEGQLKESPPMAMGCTQVQLCRNYVGDDDLAGDLLVVSLELSGIVRVWSLPEGMDEDFLQQSTGVNNSSSSSPPQEQKVSAMHEFLVEDATGTFLSVCPVHVEGDGDVKIAVACLDGSIAIVSTGVATPKSTKEASPAGTILDRWTHRDTNGSIALGGSWHPSTRSCLAISRQDGLVEILLLELKRHLRLMHHEAPVRAVSYTPDGHLLLSASDDGMVCVWDVSRGGASGTQQPVLVHHQVQAHTSWIFSLAPLQDSRRFVSCGADRRLNVWNVGQMDLPAYTYTTDQTAWSIHATNSRNRRLEQGQPHTAINSAKPPSRLVSGSEDGSLQIYSLE